MYVCIYIYIYIITYLSLSLSSLSLSIYIYIYTYIHMYYIHVATRHGLLTPCRRVWNRVGDRVAQKLVWNTYGVRAPPLQVKYITPSEHDILVIIILSY